MKFTFSWLKDHLETDKSLSEIVDCLTSIGLEVEEVDDRLGFRPFVIAQILEARKHPHADKLQLLTVNCGMDEPVSVVCGAPNARAGLIGVFAPPGSVIPRSGMTLSVGNIRGVESFGMMCSESELLLSDAHDGIIELPEDAPIGTSYAAYAGLDDPVITINLTPNRADCSCVRGIARDLSAAGMGVLKQPDFQKSFSQQAENSVNIDLDFPDQTSPCLGFSSPCLGFSSPCLGFSWRIIRNVRNCASPRWMQQRLRAIGLRPIHALVDITNYLTFDQNRPLHVFDADKISTHLTVRHAHKDEQFLALNGTQYSLLPQHCVIADQDTVLSLSGIIGGDSSKCDENTRNILLESALWDPVSIARTGRELGIISDARYRFERGIDPQFMLSGLDLATSMICQFCGGEASKAEIVGFSPPILPKLLFPFREIERLTGLVIPQEQVCHFLTLLGFDFTQEGEALHVTIPSFRPDIHTKADLVEEVIRLYGVHHIVPEPLPKSPNIQGQNLTSLQIRSRYIRRTLAARGMSEAISLSFISEKESGLFGGGKPELRLANPIAADLSAMRPSLFPGLLAATRRNIDRGFSDIALFEISDIYQSDQPDGQQKVACALRSGTAQMEGKGRFWSGNAKKIDTFSIKADALAVIKACGFSPETIQIEAKAPGWYHPGRSATLKLGPQITLGHFGELHPELLETLNITIPVYGFEMFLERFPDSKKKNNKTKPILFLSPFQQLNRDFAFIIDKTIPAATVLRAAANADKTLISSVQIFDLFEGETQNTNFGPNKKSIAIDVTIQPTKQTLTDADLDHLSKKIIDHVIKATQGTLRH